MLARVFSIHITKLLKLPDEREALFELSKGKLTTDPNNHTGKGIFFTSRAFDQFVIASGALNFTHQHDREWGFLLHLSKDTVGTLVWMNISLTTQRELTAVFNEFVAPNAFRFERTVIPVKLAIYEGEYLVSRSQAKRLMNRVERFQYVVLDFKGVNKVGQAFADEIFRVFQHRHAEIELVTINTSEQIANMIERAIPKQGGLFDD